MGTAHLLLLLLVFEEVFAMSCKIHLFHQYIEAVARRSSLKMVFLEILQNSACNFVTKRDSGTGVFL